GVTALTEDHPDGPRLLLVWSWPQTLLREREIEDLADCFSRAVRALAAHADRPDSGGFTPSDLSLVSLSQDELDGFAAEIGDDLADELDEDDFEDEWETAK
ncbi:hypothetical protein VM98_32035, partial [Streptomyces rubellomurinus subsp. indigoferus]